MRTKQMLLVGVILVGIVFSGEALGQSNRAKLLEIPKVTKDKVICFSLYTVQDNILKLTAQLYPLEEGDDMFCRLEVNKSGIWEQAAKADIVKIGWTATFRVGNWDHSKDTAYRVAHGKSAYYEGLVHRDPVDKEVITVAAFTGNSIYPGHGGDIPKNDIVKNQDRDV